MSLFKQLLSNLYVLVYLMFEIPGLLFFQQKILLIQLQELKKN